MEENNQNQAVEQTTQPVEIAETSAETASQSETLKEETPISQKVENKTYIPRKNRRNRNAASEKGGSSSKNASCGEIEDISQAKEKLSGKHVGGYENGSPEANEQQKEFRERRPRREHDDRRERGEREDRRERGERRPRREREEVSEEKVAENEASKPEQAHKGPSFEEPQFRNRSVEVSLDKRPKHQKKEAPKQDFVSYNGAETPKIGMIQRIKDIFKSVFSKKEKSAPKFKNEGRRDWKNNKGGDRRRDKSDWKNGGRNQHGGKRYHGKNGGRRDGQKHRNNSERNHGASE